MIKVIGSEKQFLGDIEPGRDKNLQYTIYLDKNLPTGAYPLPLAISYKDKNHVPVSVTLPIGLQVSGETRVSLTVSETDPEEIHAGDDDVLIKVKLDNQGNYRHKKRPRSLRSAVPVQEQQVICAVTGPWNSEIRRKQHPLILCRR